MRLLGPVDVTVDGVARPVSGLRRKAVLAVLALQPGQVVSTDRLIDAIWGGSAPPTAANALQSHVSYLRRVLGDRSAVLAQPPGYLLNVGGEATDVELAERLLRDAAQVADHADRARLLRTALDLWRGRALADIAGLPWLDEQALRLDQLWLRVRKALAEASLALGEHGPLVADLEQLVRDHPLDEPLHGLLMLALYRSGRQADALAAYRRLRDTLAGDLGIDPSPHLRDLEGAILRQDATLTVVDPALVAGPTGPGARVAAEVVPAQLPPVTQAFAGRDAELASLDEALATRGERGAARSGTVVILAVSGTAGVGKPVTGL